MGQLPRMVMNVIEGAKPKVTFPLPLQLTPGLTMLLFRIVWIAELHIEYMAIRYQGKELTTEQIAKIVRDFEPSRKNIREQVLVRHGVLHTQYIDEELLLQMAYWTHRGADPDFETAMQESIRLQQLLQHEVYSGRNVEGMEKNPLFMKDPEFASHYSSLKQTYGAPHPPEFSVVEEGKLYRLSAIRPKEPQEEEKQPGFMASLSSFMGNLGAKMQEMKAQAEKAKLEKLRLEEEEKKAGSSLSTERTERATLSERAVQSAKEPEPVPATSSHNEDDKIVDTRNNPPHSPHSS